MQRFDLYSKRQKDLANAGQSDVYKYDFVTSNFRIQLLNIANSVFGDDRQSGRSAGFHNNTNWVWVSKTYSHEMGIDPIGGLEHRPLETRSFYKSSRHDAALDLTEVIGFKIHELDESLAKTYSNQSYKPVPRIAEVNYRLREAGMGYQFEGGRLIRIDSQMVHQEIVKPTLTLLARPGYEGVQEEFLSAHAHYRNGSNKEAVSLAASSLESTFKAIFKIKQWEYKPNPRISDLVKVARENKLWPDYLDNSFDQLTATLQSGLPQIRDKTAAHGQGPVPTEVSSYLAAYALHLAATNIVFLVSAADAPR